MGWWGRPHFHEEAGFQRVSLTEFPGYLSACHNGPRCVHTIRSYDGRIVAYWSDDMTRLSMLCRDSYGCVALMGGRRLDWLACKITDFLQRRMPGRD